MARSVFYYHLKRSGRPDRDAVPGKAVEEIFHEHKGRYGYRRITAEMRNRGLVINHKTVLRLMRDKGLKSHVRKVRYRSYRGEVGHAAPNVINRDFTAGAPDRKWATDVTQMRIGRVKLYLSPILDMFNGEIVSYNISRKPDMNQIYDMLDKAFRKRENLEGLVLHSDQGWQYRQYGYRKRLEDRRIVQSMSRKGNCLDNAVMENFFGIMKTELLYPGNYSSPEKFIRDLKEYIRYYNNERIKLKLKGMAPVKYRTEYKNIL